MKPLIKLIKSSENLSALSIRLVYLTGKSPVPIHPKHLIRAENELWYKYLLKKNTVVLDAGCGSGQHSLQISPFVKKVVGIDKDSKSLEIAKKAAEIKKIKNIEFLESNLEKKLNLKSEMFDVVILFDILEHINKRQFFLKEIKRVVKKKGVILVAIPNLDTSWKKLQRKYGINSVSDPDHKIEYTKESITKELKNAGFKVVNIEPISYDTPWVGFIDLTGGISLNLYKKLSKWKLEMLKKHPENAIGFQIMAQK